MTHRGAALLCCGLSACTARTFYYGADDAPEPSRRPTYAAAPTPGWHELPGTDLESVCPDPSQFPGVAGQLGCSSVLACWSGGIADTRRQRLILWGGGVSCYYGNEIYALSLVTRTLERLTDPSPPPALCTDEGTGPDGRPVSRSGFGGSEYLADADLWYVHGGDGPCANAGGAVALGDTWTLDFPDDAALTGSAWRRRDPTDGGPPPPRTAPRASWDPVSGDIFLLAAGEIWRYEAAANRYTQVVPFVPAPLGAGTVVDPERRLLWILGEGAVLAVDLDAFTTDDASDRTRGCEALLAAYHPGLAFDPVTRHIAMHVGGPAVTLFDPDSLSCEEVTLPGDPGPGQPNGTLGRWRYFPDLGVFAVIHDWRRNAFVWRPPEP